MLGKLLKHELKDTARLFLPLNAIVLAVAAVWSVLIWIGLFDNSVLGPVGGILLLIYILSIMALFIITAAYLAFRFYKTMYANQGYLTHTLPVSSASVLNSKIIAALSWLFLAFIVCFLSILILFLSIDGFPEAADFQRFEEQISTVFGIGVFPSVCLIAGIILGFCLNMTMMVFASLSIGQLFHQRRIPAAIGAGIVFYIIQQITSVVLLFILVFGMTDFMELSPETALTESAAFYRGSFLLTIAAMFLFAAVYYIICFVITKKKLNLE